MMNDDKIKSQAIKPIAGNAIPTSEDHPLHILDNQIDPSKKTRVFDVPQVPIHTLEKDLEEEIAKSTNVSTPILQTKRSFFPFFKKNKESEQITDSIMALGEKAQKKAEPVSSIRNTQEAVNATVLEEQPKVVEKSFEDALTEARERQRGFIEKEKNTPRQFTVQVPTPTQNPTPQTQIYKTAIPKNPERSENIHTYETDIAETIKNKNSSIISLAVAESEKREQENLPDTPEPHTAKKITLLLTSVVLVLGGVWGAYYLYSISPLAVVPIKQEIKITSIVSADSQKIVSTSASNRIDLAKFFADQFNNTRPDNNHITELIINQKLASSTEKMTGSQFISKLGFGITDTLKRSLTDKWMVGVYSSNNLNTVNSFPFIILTTDFFQNAFAGMLKWESSMSDDFADILNYRNKFTQSNNTASTSIYSLYGIRGSFKDKTIANRDIREFINPQGEVILLYTFIDKNTILITTSESVIPAILDRIEKQTYVR